MKNAYVKIPFSMLYDKRISPSSKLFYAELANLCEAFSDKGCNVSNEYFADLHKTKKLTISIWIKELIKFGYIKQEIEIIDKDKRKKLRKIFIL